MVVVLLHRACLLEVDCAGLITDVGFSPSLSVFPLQAAPDGIGPGIDCQQNQQHAAGQALLHPGAHEGMPSPSTGGRGEITGRIGSQRMWGGERGYAAGLVTDALANAPRRDAADAAAEPIAGAGAGADSAHAGHDELLADPRCAAGPRRGPGGSVAQPGPGSPGRTSSSYRDWVEVWVCAQVGVCLMVVLTMSGGVCRVSAW